MIKAVLGANLSLALFMTGLIWTIQIVHYPLFASVGASVFPAYEAEHSVRITIIVGPVMLLELAAAIALVRVRPALVPVWAAWTGLVLVGIIWASTAFLQIPSHAQLAAGFDPATHAALVATNWIRTAAWTARSALLLWVSFR